MHYLILILILITKIYKEIVNDILLILSNQSENWGKLTLISSWPLTLMYIYYIVLLQHIHYILVTVITHFWSVTFNLGNSTLTPW